VSAGAARLRRSDAVTTPPEPAIALLLALARGLHESGFASPELESALTRVAQHLGIAAQFFSTPTSIFSAFGQGAEQHVHLFRVEPASVDLGKLVELEALIDAVCDGEVTTEDALVRVNTIVAGRPPFSRPVTIGAHALSSGAFALFLGGGLHETAAAGLIGLVTGIVAIIGRRIAGVARVFELVTAALAALLAIAMAHLWPPLSVFTATLAGLIILIPGFTLTIALTELASRHLASGTARFAGAMVTFLTIGFGVALGSRIGELAFGPVPTGGIGPTAPWAEAVALVVAPVAMLVLLRAPARELPWLLATGVIGFAGGRWGSRALSPELGMFVGALALGVASNLYAWWRRQPASTVLVPGILLLVPGSMGYRSLAEIMAREVLPGLATAIEMILVAVSLVAGLLAANVATPPRHVARRIRDAFGRPPPRRR
jgi:uncharacterized membrane protein YjjP (DUF1212 family)